MVKKYSFIISAILFASVTLTVNAQTASTPAPIGGAKDAHGCLTAAGYSWNSTKQACTRPFEDAQKTKTATTTTASSKKVSASKQLDITNKQLTAAIARVQDLLDRTASRLDKLSARGISVTTSRKYLAEARLKLDEAHAKAAIAKAAGDAALTVSSAKNGVAMKTVETYVRDATKIIQAAQNLVSKAISSIKPGTEKVSSPTNKKVPTTQSPR